MREYPDDITVAADDDRFYPKDWLEKLWNAWCADPASIHCHKAKKVHLDARRRVTFSENGNGTRGETLPSFWNFPSIGYGVLFGPHALHPDVINEEAFLRLSPKSNNFWIWAMAVLQGTKISMLDDNIQPGIYIDPDTNEELLEKGPCLNKEYGSGLSEIYRANILAAYPQIIDILYTENQYSSH